MRLKAPCKAVDFRGKDVFGKPFRLTDHLGKRVMLSFFRDAGCPFCNYRVYELSNNYQRWKDHNLEVVVVFSDTAEQVRRFVAQHPRPFTMMADPKLKLYNHYGVEHSALALLKALMFKLPRIIKGIAKGGRPSNNPHVRIVPADFLVNEEGYIEHIWYGRDTSDHIPLDTVNEFIDEGRARAPKIRRAHNSPYAASTFGMPGAPT
ncbi:peroxiredoxin family protein [Gilvimarinus sp. SDUM040013]|uniref:Peroxiredoxin family protein n=1 Tax=Gilvimarinus gilvus TaxID=3058038 RepID=A0ABU4S133_9GAMM|nr:peroxiredoxin family protein [Gilvimarinus sp. SDUM040013]MDO3384489.1 peroxiredoxin family protein [Gilvimarinus sp. SDUM040013]MDX6850730.1 peroxiredoxin family protein [Gilvimarinus sp. SDUM040013]